MKVKELMHNKPFMVHCTDSLAVAASVMWDQDIGSVLVVDDSNHAIGMITDRDIAMAAFTQGRALADIPVTTSMSKGLYWCDQNDDLEKAHEVMRQHQVRRLPVMEQGKRLVGMLSLNDIALAYAGRAKRDVKPESVADTLAAISKHRSLLGLAQHVA